MWVHVVLKRTLVMLSVRILKISVTGKKSQHFKQYLLLIACYSKQIKYSDLNLITFNVFDLFSGA